MVNGFIDNYEYTDKYQKDTLLFLVRLIDTTNLEQFFDELETQSQSF